MRGCVLRLRRSRTILVASVQSRKSRSAGTKLAKTKPALTASATAVTAAKMPSQRLDLHDRAQAVLAYESGLVQPGGD